MGHLQDLKKLLESNVARGRSKSYFVPSVWLDLDFTKPAVPVPVDPNEFFYNAVSRILDALHEESVTMKGSGGDWCRKAIVYNLFVRLGTAFDHDQDGKIAFPYNDDGFRETGTFLKSIALLPYIKALGADTIHLLPVTAVGQDGKKGDLGSPYAIQNPYQLDENLCTPFLNFGVEREFKAFVEAAHRLGMAVVVEFVFRTAAKDSDWAQKHPDWFYWILERVADRPHGTSDGNLYGAPLFDPDSLRNILKNMKEGDLDKTIPPPENYRNFFTAPPAAKTVRKEKGRWIGELSDGTRVRIPGAFADWPPEDPQPPWGDVTYLRMYDHPDFNYIAYNTVRMYDKTLAVPKNAKLDLWREIENVIPFYQKEYEIDGVMIDMGHALPHDLFKNMVRRARAINPNFAFWEESFGPTKESRENGFNISVGYLWCDALIPHKLKELLKLCADKGLPLPFFGTGETHDTPRVAAMGGIEASKYSWALSCLLPVVPYIHGGFEFGETRPINTGLGFSPEDIRQFPPESLALFSSVTLNWLSPNVISSYIAELARFRNKYQDILSDPSPAAFKILSEGEELEFVRGKGGQWKGDKKIYAKIHPEKKEISCRVE